MTPVQVGEVLKFLFAGWPAQRARMSAEDVEWMTKFYATGLADLELEAAIAAITRLGRMSERLPTVAAIRAAIVSEIYGPPAVGAEAWRSVRVAIASEGGGRVPGRDFTFRDPVTARIVDALGWAALCSSDNPHADRARFIEAYEPAAAAARAAAAAARGVRSSELPGAGGGVPRFEDRGVRSATPRPMAHLVAEVTGAVPGKEPA